MKKTICFLLTVIVVVNCISKAEKKGGSKLKVTYLPLLDSPKDIVGSEDVLKATELEDAPSPNDPTNTDEKVLDQIHTPYEGHALDILGYEYQEESDYLQEYVMLNVHEVALQNLDKKDSEDYPNKDQRSEKPTEQQGTPNDTPYAHDNIDYPGMKKHNGLSWLYPKKRETEPPKMSEKTVIKTQPDSPPNKQAWLSWFLFG